MSSWTIVRVEQNEYDITKSTDPNAQYEWVIRPEGKKNEIHSFINYSSVKLLMKHYQVKKVTDLAGKTFQSDEDLGHKAFLDLMKQLRGTEAATPSGTIKAALKALLKKIGFGFKR